MIVLDFVWTVILLLSNIKIHTTYFLVIIMNENMINVAKNHKILIFDLHISIEWESSIYTKQNE